MNHSIFNYINPLAIDQMQNDVYERSQPYPNMVFDEFLLNPIASKVAAEIQDLANEALSETPHLPDWEVISHNSGLAGHNKLELHPLRVSGIASSVRAELTSDQFVSNLRSLTGKSSLVADPTYNGGGLHSSGGGGRLGLHIDFRKHPTLGLKRELNLLVYLTDNWNSNYGGDLELRSSPRAAPKIVEFRFNRALLFETSDSSWHGHPEPLNLSDGVRRNSIALYYYSPFEIGDDERFDNGTTRYSFSAASTVKDKLTAAKFGAYNSMRNLSSWGNAHLFEPLSRRRRR